MTLHMTLQMTHTMTHDTLDVTHDTVIFDDRYTCHLRIVQDYLLFLSPSAIIIKWLQRLVQS